MSLRASHPTLFTLHLLTLFAGVHPHLAAFGSGGWRNSPPIVSSAQYRSQIMPRIFGGEAEKCVGGGSYSVTGGCATEDNAVEVRDGGGMGWNDAPPQQYQPPTAPQRPSGVVAGHYQLRKSPPLRGAIMQTHPQPPSPAGLPSYREVIRVSQRAPTHNVHAMHSYPRGGVEPSGGGTRPDRGIPSYLQAPPRPTFSRPSMVAQRGRSHVYAG